MLSNLSKHEKDLNSLMIRGHQLVLAMRYMEKQAETMEQIELSMGSEAEKFIKSLPSFTYEYQTWYTESKVVVQQIIPARISDFIMMYDRPNRKSLLVHNYTIDDYLNELSAWEFVKPALGIGRIEQQVAILRSAKQRFVSSLFDIRRQLAVELFDGEIAAARELFDKRFFRAAGTVASVVFERHLLQICQNHDIKLPKKKPTIGDLNELLKGAGVIEIAPFRTNQFLDELCGRCVLSKAEEPTAEQVLDLIDGVAKILKTVL